MDVFNIARSKVHRHEDPYKHFSFLVNGKSIAAVGRNRGTLRCMRSKYPEHSKIHSEYDVLRRARAKTMINIRINNAGELRNSKPCDCCCYYMRLFGVRVVYYTTRNGWERMKL